MAFFRFLYQVCLGYDLVISIFGIWACGKTADDLGVHDHPAIVWDEVAGYYITMIGAALSWQTLLVGFLLFRFFDIAKPGPVDKRILYQRP